MSTALPAVHRVLHVIVPQREGAIGGADLHVLDLAAAQQQDGTYRPLILAPRAPRDYLQRLDDADLEVLSSGLFRPGRYRRLPRQRGITLIHAHMLCGIPGDASGHLSVSRPKPRSSAA